AGIVREELAAIRAALATGDRAALAASSPAVPEVPALAAATRDDPPGAREARPSPRSHRWWLGGGLAIIAAVLALSVYAWRARRADPRDPVAATDRCTGYVRDGCADACGAGIADACYRWGQGLYTGLGGFTIDRPAAV